jgi:serine/threonine protein kinase
MAKREEWEEIKPLGEGGQSEVFLVRSPARVAERKRDIRKLKELSGQGFSDITAREFAETIIDCARDERTSELGALKVFNPRAAGPEGEQQAVARLRSEIAVLGQGRPGLLKLLDSNDSERWIVTEYCPGGTLQDHPFGYTGKAGLALTAFRSLVETIAGLHQENIVHRDIKPANVFIGNDGRLILGDFGIVYLPNQAARPTSTNESVGPSDYIPPWADVGERLEKVQPKFDVYMLGKLLWCMVAGKLRLFREWYWRPEYDLTEKFKDDPHMHAINAILDKCVVEDPDKCLPGAQELLLVVEQHLSVIRRGGQMLSDDVPRPCRVCGQGFYRPSGETGAATNQVVGLPSGSVSVPGSAISSWRHERALFVRPLACTVCKHVEFFLTS